MARFQKASDYIDVARQAWRDKASCRNHDPALWDDDHPDQDDAIRICHFCPVAEPCLIDAIEHDERSTIRGGLTAAQRPRKKHP